MTETQSPSFPKRKMHLNFEKSNLAKLSKITGVDLSKFPLKKPFKFSGPDFKDGAIMGSIQNMTLLSEEATEAVTPEMFTKTFKWPYPTGTPEMAADVFQEWIEKTNCDGFNLVYASNPGSYEDVVDMLVPVLQRRGFMWDDYASPGDTYRENLHNNPGNPYLSTRHPGSKFKWNAPETENLSRLEHTTAYSCRLCAGSNGGSVINQCKQEEDKIARALETR